MRKSLQDYIIRSETEQRYKKKTAMRRDQKVKIRQKRIGAKWAKKGKLVCRRVLKGGKEMAENSKPLNLE